jgi:preprotein translocase subunit YajC|tara:strand:+ start:7656 stop:7970 length:315 start_codon:yes stop_codon:yes gene_type:complete
MNTILLQAGSESGGWEMPVMMAAIFGVMYFFMIRPQKRKEKELAKKRDDIKKGDAIVTAGGIHGVVTEYGEENLVISVESQAKLRIEKSSIAMINGEGTGTGKK